MHPVIKEGVSIGTFEYEGSDDVHYFVENAEGEEFEISYKLWKALLGADGTRPLSLPDGGRDIIPRLKQDGIIQTSRFLRGKESMNRFVLFPVGSRSRGFRPYCRLANAALFLSAVPVFAAGVYLTASGDPALGDFFSWFLYYGLILCSMFLHEAGHLIAGIAYGYRITDMGILLFGILPVGAYVAHEDRKKASRGQRIQFALAGIEMNLLLAGICLLTAMHSVSLSLLMLGVANINVVFAAVNLLPARGLDGESALSALCGVESISETAKEWLFSRKLRRKLLRAGLQGYLYFGVFALTLAARVIFWLLAVVDIVYVLHSLF